MAKPPETPRPPHRRKRSTAHKSATGKVIGSLTGVAATTAVLVGLHGTPTEPSVLCGGSERWPVKVANDPAASKIDLNPQGPFTVAQLNTLAPEPLPPDGRRPSEKKEYVVRGFLSYFKHEGGSADHDYHVVITDKPGDFEPDEQKAPNGRSIVVEFPDTKCFGGKTGLGAHTSALGPAIGEARLAFETQTKGLDGKHINKPIPVTVTGVGFFDRAHHQTGRSTEHPQSGGQNVVFELHPVTEIGFDGQEEPD